MAAEFMQYLNPVDLGPSSKGVLNVPQRAQTISPRTIPKLLSTTSLTLFLFKGA
jgi:hypothetical protein